MTSIQNKEEKQNQVILIDAKKVFEDSQHPFMLKIFSGKLK